MTRCQACNAPYHADCWNDNGGCAVYGCSQVPPTEKLTDVEVPPSFWGQERKPCPVCGGDVLAAALRCRHCGATFQTARPQDTQEFSRDASRKMREPALHKAAIWVLVLGLIPFTAPFCLVGGGIWFMNKRAELAAAPPVTRALAWIGLGVAAVQIVLFTLFITLFSATSR